MTYTTRFPHERLDAYRVASELVAEVEALAREFPKGFADLKDQLRRAAGATLRNIAEGANRFHPRDKAARFAVAKGEVGECDTALHMVALCGLSDDTRIGPMRVKADRVGAMLMGLIRRERDRAPRAKSGAAGA